MGRSLLHRDEVTLPDVLSRAGWHTSIFGKWHLGKSWPLRPQDSGFRETLIHGGDGIQQTPDTWGNDCFDDTYLRNGQPGKFTGYCTDVWFDQAVASIDRRKAERQPFFVYLAPNAPHSPYIVAEKYSQPYVEMGSPHPWPSSTA